VKTLKIKTDKIREFLNIETIKFPKYSAPLINLANRFIGGTRPKVVGQMSELIKEFKGKNFKEWEKWYRKKHPDGIEEATKRIIKMMESFKDVMEKIDESTIKNWVRDLVVMKTFEGLKVQEAVLKSVAGYFKVKYRLSTPAEEARGIDGFIGKSPVSIKPESYELKDELPESIDVPIIFYVKAKDGIKISFPEDLA